ncbi:hypothetical protein [Streptomyces sp. NPDC000410]|uniref:hypothetical protein n=1 Tax=Streptomyces sp. NPDC000410 TaxID=3154254 RepID=UPI0033208AD7
MQQNAISAAPIATCALVEGAGEAGRPTYNLELDGFTKKGKVKISTEGHGSSTLNVSRGKATAKNVPYAEYTASQKRGQSVTCTTVPKEPAGENPPGTAPDVSKVDLSSDPTGIVDLKCDAAAKIIFTGNITTSGPGVVNYTWNVYDGTKVNRTEEFDKAGTRPVSFTSTIPVGKAGDIRVVGAWITILNDTTTSNEAKAVVTCIA